MFVNAMYAACSLAGLVMVVGGIWLIAKQKIYIDRETMQPITVEIPFGVRFKANSPALAFFVIGFVPLLFPVWKLNPQHYRHVEQANLISANPSPLSQEVDPSNRDMDVYVAVASHEHLDPGQEMLRLPVSFIIDDSSGDATVRVLFISNNYVLNRQTASWKAAKGQDGKIVLTFPDIPAAKHYVTSQVDPVPSGFRR